MPKSEWFKVPGIDSCLWEILTEITVLYEMRGAPNVIQLKEVIISLDNLFLVMNYE